MRKPELGKPIRAVVIVQERGKEGLSEGRQKMGMEKTRLKRWDLGTAWIMAAGWMRGRWTQK